MRCGSSAYPDFFVIAVISVSVVGIVVSFFFSVLLKHSYPNWEGTQAILGGVWGMLLVLG